MDQGDVEGLADAVRSLAGLERDEYATPLTIAKRLLGADGVRIVPGLIERESLSTVNGRRMLFVRKSLSKPMRAFAIAHGLGHWIAEREGVVFADEIECEHACDRLGGAIHQPRAVFRSAVRVHSDNWTQLALAFGTTETQAALRFGEVTDAPIAVVSPIIRFRGKEIAWPRTREEFDRYRRKLPRNVKVARLTDDTRRYAYEVEDVFDDVG